MIDEKAIRVRLWGQAGSDSHMLAIAACHEFAQASGCPAGGDVILWLSTQTTRWQAECSAEYEKEKP